MRLTHLDMLPPRALYSTKGGAPTHLNASSSAAANSRTARRRDMVTGPMRDGDLQQRLAAALHFR